MKLRSRVRPVAGLLIGVALAMNSACSTNAVAQSAATTFFNAVATNIVNAFFAAASG